MIGQTTLPSLGSSLRHRFIVSRWLLPLALLFAGSLVFCVDLAGSCIGPQIHKALDFAVYVMVIPLVFGHAIQILLLARSEAKAERASALEAERLALSRELHDSIAQQIGYLHFQLDVLAKRAQDQGSDQLHDELEKMRQVSQEAYQDLYCLMSGLRQSPPDCLSDSLLDRAQRIGKRAGFDVDLSTVGEPRPLTVPAMEQIQNIVREGLNNAAKHAAASRVRIKVLWRHDLLAVVVEDNGRGFSPRDAERAGHFGLKIMQERAAQIGGTLRIHSNPGSGTLVGLSVPLSHVSEHAAPQSA